MHAGEAFGTGFFMMLAGVPEFLFGVLGTVALYVLRFDARPQTFKIEKVIV